MSQSAKYHYSRNNPFSFKGTINSQLPVIDQLMPSKKSNGGWWVNHFENIIKNAWTNHCLADDHKNGSK